MLGSSNKFDPNTDIPDLTGKIYVDLHQVDEVEKQLASKLQRLDVLIFSAAGGVGPYSETKDGIDSHMQVNVVAQHHLAMLPLPKLLNTPDRGLCFQESEVHRAGTTGVESKDIAAINQDIDATSLYGRTKLAMTLLVKALARRKQRGELGFTPGAAPWVNATHPGDVRTDQNFQMTEAYGLPSKLGEKAIRPFMNDPVDEGCRSVLVAATSSAISEEKIDGQYIVPYRKVTSPSSQTEDGGLQERCWKLVDHILTGKLRPLPYANRDNYGAEVMKLPLRLLEPDSSRLRLIYRT
ncbi:hypothetical protein DL768_007537 [Monosporascus sp. mg162]|nr:hypothetical protein DL768_007537 [Monosporascus sp. mg162]